MLDSWKPGLWSDVRSAVLIRCWEGEQMVSALIVTIIQHWGDTGVGMNYLLKLLDIFSEFEITMATTTSCGDVPSQLSGISFLRRRKELKYPQALWGAHWAVASAITWPKSRWDGLGVNYKQPRGVCEGSMKAQVSVMFYSLGDFSNILHCKENEWIKVADRQRRRRTNSWPFILEAAAQTIEPRVFGLINKVTGRNCVDGNCFHRLARRPIHQTPAAGVTFPLQMNDQIPEFQIKPCNLSFK